MEGIGIYVPVVLILFIVFVAFVARRGRSAKRQAADGEAIRVDRDVTD